MPMSTYIKNALVNVTLRATAYTAPSVVYIGLYTSDPTVANTGTEVSGGGYARQTSTWTAPTAGATATAAAVEFPQATAAWGTIGWVGILDAATGGNLLYFAPLTASKVIASGDIFRFAAGSITDTLS